MIFSLLIVAAGLALALIVMAYLRIRKEGLTLTDGKREHFVRSIEDVQRQHDRAKIMMDESDHSVAGDVVYFKAGFGKRLQLPVQEAVTKVIKALEAKGYKLLVQRDVVKTVGREELPPCRMVMAYHPELAGRAFELVPHVGLPACQAVIRQDMSDAVYLEFLDPTLASPLVKYGELGEIAFTMKTDLLGVLQEL